MVTYGRVKRNNKKPGNQFFYEIHFLGIFGKIQKSKESTEIKLKSGNPEILESRRSTATRSHNAEN